MQNVKEILNTWMNELGVSTYKELAEILEVSQATMDSWKQRGKIPEKNISKYKFIRDKQNDELMETMLKEHSGELFKNIDDLKSRLYVDTSYQLSVLLNIDKETLLDIENGAKIPESIQKAATALEAAFYSLISTCGFNIEPGDVKRRELVSLIKYAPDELIEQLIERLRTIKKISQVFEG